VESLAQGPVFVGIAQFAQQSPDFLRSSPGLSDQPQRGREGDPSHLRVLEHAALENAALRWPIRVDATGAILAESRARLGKAGDGLLPARKRDRQPQHFQFLDIVTRFEFDEVKKRPVAAQPAREAEFFAWFHDPSIRLPAARGKVGLKQEVFQLISRRRGGRPGWVSGARWTQGGTGLPG
jgi:hypothetical protein